MNEHVMHEQNIAAYALGALDANERAGLEAHLQTCAVCQRELATYMPVLHELHSLPAPIPPRLSSHRRTATWSLQSLYPIAAVLLLCAGVFGGAQFERAQNNDMVAVAAMAASSAQEVRLNGMRVEGRAIVGSGRRRTAFVLDGLPPLPAGKAYQVWIEGPSTTSPGVLHRNGDGYEVLVVPGDLLERASNVAVTVESEAGSASMDGAQVASGST